MSRLQAGTPSATGDGCSVAASLDDLARFGRTANGGVTRVAWSAELFDAYAWVGDRLRDCALHVGTDAAGNLIGRWEAGTGSASWSGRISTQFRPPVASTGLYCQSRVGRGNCCVHTSSSFRSRCERDSER
jgi:hypothetical protein